jgi:hypothetical protein
VFLVSCVERGTLDAVLKECGFELATSGKIHIRKPATPPFVTPSLFYP